MRRVAKAKGQEVRKEEKVESFKIQEIEEDADEDVTLEEFDAEKDAEAQGRLEESQVQVEEVIEVVTATKLMTELVTTATTTLITVAPIPKASAPRRRRGVIIQDPEKATTASLSVQSEVKSKDKGKGILVKEPKPLKRQAQIQQDEAFARELEAKLNANINWNEVIEQTNTKVHLNYLKHLKESVATLREIVEEAQAVRPLDRSLASACHNTKHSQELLEYAVGTFPKDFNNRDNKHASTPLTRNNQVTFANQCVTSNNNTHKHVEQLNIQKANVFVIPSTRVNSCTDASGSKPRSNTKKNRISQAKVVNKEKVKEHPKTNKFSLNRMNHFDSSISFTLTVIQIILWYLDSGCSKHITGDCSRLRNFIKKFIETVRFRNDHFGSIMGYGDYVIGDSVISKNDNVERRNRALVEAARTMMIFFKALMFLWAEAVATACYIQNQSLIHTHHNKILYELVHNKKPDLTFLYVFGALCYPINDSEDLGKLQPIADIRIFIGYEPSRKEPPRVERLVSSATVVSVLVNLVGTPSSTTIDQDAPSPSHSPSSSALQSLCLHHGVAAASTSIEDNPLAPVDNDPFVNVFASEPSFEASTSKD
nr:integrase, catalytic region, zinc finger, CCHC-type, peptidase aspartic, catalytic [Tanacetum cinerariifolium]